MNWRRCDFEDGSIFFNTRSGDTHALDPLCVALCDGAAPPASTDAQIRAAREQLQQLGLPTAQPR